MLLTPPGYTPTRAQDPATKAYVDGKVGSGGGSGTQVGVPTFIQSSAPSYTGGPYVWYQTDANNNVVNVFVETVGVAAAALPTAGLVNRWSSSSVSGVSAGAGVYSLNPSTGDIVLQESTTPPTLLAAANGLNGKQGLSFNGTSTKLTYSSGTNYQIPQPYTLVAVVNVKDTNINNGQQVMNLSGSEIGINAGGAGYSTYSGSEIRGGTAQLGGQLLMVGVDAGGAGAITVNGSQVASGNAGTNSTSQVRLGAHPNNTWFANMDGYEWMVYNKNLLAAANSSDLSALKAWVRQQYGLTIA